MGQRILFVEDDPSIRELTRRLLELEGYTDVVEAPDGAAALALFREAAPDLVLLDLHMPRTDGFALLEALTREADDAFVPVLVVTADTSVASRRRALEAGATDLITKPYDGLELVLRVRNLLSLREAQRRIMDQNRGLEAQVRSRTRELEEMAARLRELDRLKDDFLASVSHEVRTPLTAVHGFAQTLERFGESLTPQRRAEIARRLVGQTRRLSRILAGLLDLDRLQRGILTPYRAGIDVFELVERVIAEIDLGRHVVDVEADGGVAIVDGAHVERILDSLLLNAVRHTPEDSTVRLRISFVQDGISIGVDDEGAGVPDAMKDLIFEPFLTSNNPEHRPGLGIDLALVAQLARLHDGRAWVEDRPGGGSSFRVFLRAETIGTGRSLRLSTPPA